MPELGQTTSIFVNKRFNVDSVTLTPINLVNQDAYEVTIRNSNPIVGFWIYTDPLDEATKEYVYPGMARTYSDPSGLGHRPPPFRRDVNRLWVKVDSGVGPMETTWRVATVYSTY